MKQLVLESKEEASEFELTPHQEYQEGTKPRKLSPKHELLLRLVAAGDSVELAGAKCGLSYGHARVIITSAPGQYYLNTLQNALDAEFKALYQDVIQTIKDGLQFTEPQIRLAAASLWLKSEKSKLIIAFTAEDSIRKLVDGEAEEAEEAEITKKGVDIDD